MSLFILGGVDREVMCHLVDAMFPLAFDYLLCISASFSERAFSMHQPVLELSLVYLAVRVDADALSVTLAAEPAAVVFASR